MEDDNFNGYLHYVMDAMGSTDDMILDADEPL